MLEGLLLALLAAPQPLSLAQALSRAEAQNPELLAAQRDLPVARAGAEVASQLPNPTVSVSVGPDDPKVFGVIDQKLPIFGQRGTAIDAARAEVPVVEAEVAVQAIRLRASVRRAYFALAAAAAQEQLAEQTRALASDLAQMTEAKFQAGSAPRLEAEQAQLARQRAEQERLDRAAVTVSARVALAQLTGDAPDAELTPSDPLAPLPQAPPLDVLLTALARSPELAALRHKREAALLRADRERAAARPVPDVSLEVERLGTSPGVGLRGGLAFELPVLSQNRGHVHEAQAQASAAAAQAQAALLRLSAQVRAARARWEAAARRARFYQSDFVPAALRLLEMARTGYQLGRAPLVSVLQAQNEVAAARSKALDAGQEAQGAFADLEEASGGQL